MSEPQEKLVAGPYPCNPQPTRFFAAMGMAGATYPVVVYIFVAIGSSISTGGGIPEEVDARGVTSLAVATAIGCFVGILGGLVSLALATGFCATLGLSTQGPRFWAFAGGLLGVIPILVVLTVIPHRFTAVGWGDVVTIFLVGPGLATPLFQLAGAWSEWQTDEMLPRDRVRGFGIRQVLAATAWIALALAVAKLVGWLTPWAGMWFAAWLVYQWCTMWLVLRFLGWRGLMGIRNGKVEMRG